MESGREGQNAAVGLTILALAFVGGVGIKAAVEGIQTQPATREVRVSQPYVQRDSLQCLGGNTLQMTLPGGRQDRLPVGNCEQDDVSP